MKTALLPVMPPLLLLAVTLVQTGERSAPREVAVTTLTFQDLSSALLPETEGGAVEYPAWLEALDGQRVAVAGFMAPFDQLDDLSVFMLMPSYVGCYFCAPPSFTQVLLVRQKEEDRARKRPFIDPPIRVTGVLRLYRPASTHPAHRDQFVYALDEAECEVVSGNEAPKRAPGHGAASPLLGRAKAEAAAPGQTAQQPHAAFQPQLLVPSITALRNLPLTNNLRFVKADPGEIVRRLRGQIEAELSRPAREVLERVLTQLGWLRKGEDWAGALASLMAEQRVGVVDAKGGRVIYHQDLPLSKPAGRLAIAALIHEALLRQNHPALFEPSSSVDAWLARRAVLLGDSAVVQADYIRRNWLSAPDPLSPLEWPEASAAAAPQVRQWLQDNTQAAENLIRRHRGRDAEAFLDSLYLNPPASSVYFLAPAWIHQEPAPLPPPPLATPGRIVAETRLGSAVLGVWLAQGQLQDLADARALLTRLERDRAAFVRPDSEGGELFVWETQWPNAEDAAAFARLARQAVRPPVPASASALAPPRLEVIVPDGSTTTVVLQATALPEDPAALDASVFNP